MSVTIPSPDELRADIRARAEELRALRRLLKVSEAAQQTAEARHRRTRPLQESAVAECSPAKAASRGDR
jgi:hypothetical protein